MLGMNVTELSVDVECDGTVRWRWNYRSWVLRMNMRVLCGRGESKRAEC